MSLKTVYYQGRKAYVLYNFVLLTNWNTGHSSNLNDFVGYIRDALLLGVDVEEFCYIECLYPGMVVHDSLDKMFIGELKC